METSFWHQRWEKSDIGFHKSEVNPLLVSHFAKLDLPKGMRIFLPLCGKTRDFSWLLDNGYRVVGAELSELAINQLFRDLGIEPSISRIAEFDHYHAKDIDIFVGNFFDLTAEILGPVNAVYDRAALVALPSSMRNQYAIKLMQITNSAPQLLICYEYNQQLMDGPPFSIENAEVKKHYGDSFELVLAESRSVQGKLKGQVAAIETVWLLHRATETE
jgi:thiopurine S-methyltransferase